MLTHPDFTNKLVNIYLINVTPKLSNIKRKPITSHIRIYISHACLGEITVVGKKCPQ